MVGPQWVQEIQLNMLWCVVEFCSLLLLYRSVQYSTPLITPADKAMLTLSLTMKVSKYSATCVSDHLY